LKKDYKTVISSGEVLQGERELAESYWNASWASSILAQSFDDVVKDEVYPLMQPYLDDLATRNNTRILDAGCGLGRWTVFLNRRGFDVYGIDISKPTIERLRTDFPECCFQYGDICRMDFPDEFFDFCFSFGVIEHFEVGLGPCLQELNRVLKPGGHLFVTIPYQNWGHILRDAKPYTKWGEGYEPEKGILPAPRRFYQWRLTSPELERELAFHGFRVLDIKPTAKLVGICNMLNRQFWLKEGSIVYRIVQRLLLICIPKACICHMLLAIGQKR